MLCKEVQERIEICINRENLRIDCKYMKRFVQKKAEATQRI